MAFSTCVSAQKQVNSQDSIRSFYNAVFAALKKKYLLKKEVNWTIVEAETQKALGKYTTFGQSLNEIGPLFDKIKAGHCGIYLNDVKYTSTAKISGKTNYTAQWKKKYATNPEFEVSLLEQKYGYILMPKIIFFDVSAENIGKVAQPLYDQIEDLKSKNEIEGWIIDLRLNTGGNSMPMVLALYDFLGDNIIGGVLDAQKKQQSIMRLKQGKYIDQSKSIPQIQTRGKLLDQMKVAVLTGNFTASAGEVVALAFKRRPNTILIGGKTYGATTSNIMWNLPFGATMALTTGYDCDRNGVYHEQIVPDILHSDSENFEQLPLDRSVVEAIHYFNEKK